MPSSKTIGILTRGALAAALYSLGQGAFAHTTVKDQATEGTTAYNALQIGHGCTKPNGKNLPIIAESVVLPTVNPVALRTDPNDATKTIPVNLADVISDAQLLAGKVDLVQDRNVFKKQNEIYDASGANVIGFYATNGNLQTNLRGLVPFRFTPPTFIPSDAGHCAKRLLIKIAIADICVKDVFPPQEGTANLWIPNATAKFPDGNIDGSSPNYHGGGAATLTVNRKGALDPACGAGYDVTVWPSDEDVDANLPIKGYWGR